MILESVRVRNFRSVKDATLRCDRLTALVGANGSGKSSFLKAIEVFCDDKTKVSKDDYHKSDTGNEMSVSATFGDLSTEQAKEFSGYVNGGKLTVERVFVWDEAGRKADSTLYGERRTNPDFVGVRTATETKEIRAMYNELRGGEKYDLPSATAVKEILAQLDAYDMDHPDQCTAVIDRAKFDLQWNGADRFVKFVTVPAVHNVAEDVNYMKGSLLTLLTMTVRQSIEGSKEYKEHLGRMRAERMEMVEKFGSGLGTVEDSITENIRRFASGAKVGLAWSDEPMDVGLPKIDAVLTEDGYESTVDRAGHGSQRALVVAMLQAMGQMRQDGVAQQAEAGSPTLILAIEEPELYQHPIRQRHISAVLDSLTESADRRMQIIYTTHSPHFAGIDKLERVRLLRKAAPARGTRSTKVHETDIQKLLKRLEQLGVDRSKEAMEERLKIIMTPWLNEGFFAETVVLVEGISDYAAIMGMSRLKEKKFEASGVSVIPCHGISNIPDLFVVFDELKIPAYAVWDLDNGDPNKQKSNLNARLMLQRLFGSEPKSTQIKDGFSCFDTDLEGEMKQDMTEILFDKLLNEQRQIFGMDGQKAKQVLAKPRVMYEMLKQAKDAGRPCTALEKIVDRIHSKASVNRVA